MTNRMKIKQQSNTLHSFLELSPSSTSDQQDIANDLEKAHIGYPTLALVTDVLKVQANNHCSQKQ